MATTLFVGKLSFDTTDDSLQALFAQYGTVSSAKVIIDRESNRSKGFGFVDMADQTAAEAAIAALNNTTFEGREIVVSIARPREDRSQDAGAGFRGGFQRR